MHSGHKTGVGLKGKGYLAICSIFSPLACATDEAIVPLVTTDALKEPCLQLSRYRLHNKAKSHLLNVFHGILYDFYLFNIIAYSYQLPRRFALIRDLKSCLKQTTT